MIQTGPVILAMNHQSYLDPPLAGITCDRAIYFLARRTLTEVPLLGWLFKSKGSDRESRELVVFITPSVLRSGPPTPAPGQ